MLPRSGSSRQSRPESAATTSSVARSAVPPADDHSFGYLGCLDPVYADTLAANKAQTVESRKPNFSCDRDMFYGNWVNADIKPQMLTGSSQGGPLRIQDVLGYSESGSADRASRKHWRYEDRRRMQEIIPGVFLGPAAEAGLSKLEYLKQRGVTHIVCVRSVVESRFVHPYHPDAFQYLTVNIQDKEGADIGRYFLPVARFMDDALAQRGKVLVHGLVGNSRSATLVMAFLMEKFYMDFKQAYKAVEEKRESVHPRESFRKQLMAFKHSRTPVAQETL